MGNVMLRKAVLSLLVLAGGSLLEGCGPLPLPPGPLPPLQVQDTTPAAGNEAVEVLPPLSATFSRTMEASSFQASAFTLEGEGPALTGTVAIQGTVATLQLPRPLWLLGRYTAALSSGVRDVTGVPLTEPYTWSFRIRDGQWRKAPQLLGSPARSSEGPQVAVAADGRSLALWAESDGQEQRLWWSESIPGAGWTAAARLETGGGSPGDPLHARLPQLAMNGKGETVAVWLQSEGSFITTLWSSRHVPQQGWTPARRVLAAPSGDASIVRLALDEQGHALALWTQFDGDTSSENVWAVGGGPGQDWGSASRLDTNLEGLSAEPQLSVSADGHALAAWYRFDAEMARSTVWASRYVPGAGWSAAEPMDAEDSQSYLSEPLAGPGGAALVLWSRLSGNDMQLWSRRYEPGQGWQAKQLLERTLGTSGGAQASQERAGKALVLWPRFDGEHTRLTSRFYSFSAGWQEAEDVGLIEQGDARDPQVVLDPRGHALAVWTQAAAAGGRIAASRYVAGAGWSPATVLDDEPGAFTGGAQVSSGASGRAAAVWLHDGAQSRVGSNLFE